MNDQMLLSVAGAVFAMLVVGLGLTIWEFRHGQPRQDARDHRKRRRDDLD